MSFDEKKKEMSSQEKKKAWEDAQAAFKTFVVAARQAFPDSPTQQEKNVTLSMWPFLETLAKALLGNDILTNEEKQREVLSTCTLDARVHVAAMSPEHWLGTIMLYERLDSPYLEETFREYKLTTDTVLKFCLVLALCLGPSRFHVHIEYGIFEVVDGEEEQKS